MRQFRGGSALILIKSIKIRGSYVEINGKKKLWIIICLSSLWSEV